MTALPTRRSKGAQIVIETIYDIMNKTKQPEPRNNVLFLCERYKLTEEEKQEVLTWLSSSTKKIVKAQYANALKSLLNMEGVILSLVGGEDGKQISSIRDMFSWDVNKEEMVVEVIGVNDRGKLEVLDKTIPFTTTFRLSWDKDTKLSVPSQDKQ